MDRVVIEFTGNAPVRQNDWDAGYDLICAEDTVVKVGGAPTLVRTGTRIALPKTHFAMLVVRSSLGAKRSIGLANDVGIIDAGYRGEIMAAMQIRDGYTLDQKLAAGERIAQLVILPVPRVEFVKVKALDATVRGEGGFGSTGK